MRKIGLLLIAVMMILPAMAQVSFGVRAGGAYSFVDPESGGYV